MSSERIILLKALMQHF